jgi:hypothetical protein
MADTPRILWTITAFPFVRPYLSLSVHVLPLMCRQCPMVIRIITPLFAFSAMTPSTMYSPLMPLSRCLLHIIYLPIHVFSPICQHLFEVTDLTTRGYSFWRFQPPNARYMLSRLYRKVNPFRSDLLLLLLLLLLKSIGRFPGKSYKSGVCVRLPFSYSNYSHENNLCTPKSNIFHRLVETI